MISTAQSFPAIRGSFSVIGVLSGHWESLPFAMGSLLTITRCTWFDKWVRCFNQTCHVLDQAGRVLELMNRSLSRVVS